MLTRAWGRSLALLMRSPAALVFPNLEATAALAFMGLLCGLAAAAQAPAWSRALLNFLSGLAAWMAFSWLAYGARRALEEPGFRPGWAAFAEWARLRGWERLKSFGMCLAAGLWMALAFAFYRGAAGSFWLAAVALALCILVGLAALSALALNFGLCGRKRADIPGEWKASLMMALAFAPQCLGALASAALLAAAVFLLPVFSAGLIAAFLTALSDEFLAKSHGMPPPAYEPFKFKELMRPWK